MTVQYLYDVHGKLSDTIARTNGADPSSVLTHTRYEYDTRGNLVREWQGHNGLLGATPPTSTAKVDYEWSYLATNTPGGVLGRDRLTAVVYPRPPSGTEAARRRVELAYGATDSTDDRISRLTDITSAINSVSHDVAQFEYAGVSRRAAMTLGGSTNTITADLRASGGTGQPIGLTGLDSFGRLRDLHYRNTATTTLLRCEHGYGIAGDRLFDRVTQWISSAQT